MRHFKRIASTLVVAIFFGLTLQAVTSVVVYRRAIADTQNSQMRQLSTILSDYLEQALTINVTIDSANASAKMAEFIHDYNSVVSISIVDPKKKTPTISVLRDDAPDNTTARIGYVYDDINSFSGEVVGVLTIAYLSETDTRYGTITQTIGVASIMAGFIGITLAIAISWYWVYVLRRRTKKGPNDDFVCFFQFSIIAIITICAPTIGCGYYISQNAPNTIIASATTIAKTAGTQAAHVIERAIQNEIPLDKLTRSGELFDRLMSGHREIAWMSLALTPTIQSQDESTTVINTPIRQADGTIVANVSVGLNMAFLAHAEDTTSTASIKIWLLAVFSALMTVIIMATTGVIDFERISGDHLHST